MMHGLFFALRHPFWFLWVNLLALTMQPGKSYYETRRWQKLRDYTEARDAGRCRARGCKVSYGLDTHHKRPISRGGSHFTWNLVKLCRAHHALRHPRNAPMQARIKD